MQLTFVTSWQKQPKRQYKKCAFEHLVSVLSHVLLSSAKAGQCSSRFSWSICLSLLLKWNQFMNFNQAIRKRSCLIVTANDTYARWDSTRSRLLWATNVIIYSSIYGYCWHEISFQFCGSFFINSRSADTIINDSSLSWMPKGQTDAILLILVSDESVWNVEASFIKSAQ